MKPIYSVVLKAQVGAYEGDWNPAEKVRYEHVTFLYLGESKDEADRIFKEHGGELELDGPQI